MIGFMQSRTYEKWSPWIWGIVAGILVQVFWNMWVGRAIGQDVLFFCRLLGILAGLFVCLFCYSIACGTSNRLDSIRENTRDSARYLTDEEWPLFGKYVDSSADWPVATVLLLIIRFLAFPVFWSRVDPGVFSFLVAGTLTSFWRMNGIRRYLEKKD